MDNAYELRNVVVHFVHSNSVPCRAETLRGDELASVILDLTDSLAQREVTHDAVSLGVLQVSFQVSGRDTLTLATAYSLQVRTSVHTA